MAEVAQQIGAVVLIAFAGAAVVVFISAIVSVFNTGVRTDRILDVVYEIRHDLKEQKRKS